LPEEFTPMLAARYSIGDIGDIGDEKGSSEDSTEEKSDGKSPEEK
jgi:hypothetical protein